MISKVIRISTKHGTWYYQKFGPDSLNPKEPTAFRLYDHNGDFAEEFGSYEDMKAWIVCRDFLTKTDKR